tara:strand:+ start:158 stop:394 length:237 start_codon:yes stop_codon:yes gene_type:complete
MTLFQHCLHWDTLKGRISASFLSAGPLERRSRPKAAWPASGFRKQRVLSQTKLKKFLAGFLIDQLLSETHGVAKFLVG